MSVPSESERVQWVRYAADCAERVLPIVPPRFRGQAEAAIVAARLWADEPTEMHRTDAWMAAYAATCIAASDCVYAAVYAADAAAHATHAIYAGYAAVSAVCASLDPAQERVWQAERRKYYGLPEAMP